MRFEAGNTSTLVTGTADAPLVAIRAPATEIGRLLELGVFLTAATATRLGLARATTVSITPGTTKPGRAVFPGTPAAPLADSATLLVASWGTAPVISLNYLRKISLPATVGAGFIWTWPVDRPLIVGDGEAIAEIVLANLVAVAPSLFDFYGHARDPVVECERGEDRRGRLGHRLSRSRRPLLAVADSRPRRGDSADR